MLYPGRALLPFAILALGCSNRPSAPPLLAEAVYQNDKIGVRFLAPEGWPIVSRADLPPETPMKPVVLVAYMLSAGGPAAEFELLAADLPEASDVGRFLAEYRIGSEKWTAKPLPEAVIVDGEPASRYSMTRGKGKDEYRREATVFLRGSRVYAFLITFAAGDSERREQARRSVESVAWVR